MARACGWCGTWNCKFQDTHEDSYTPVTRYKPISATERSQMDLFADSEYRRLVAVRDAAEAKFHQAVIVRHQAYVSEAAAQKEKIRAGENLERFIRAKKLDKE